MSMNVVILTGRLTAEPEMKYTQSGKSYAKFSLAVNRRYNREETDFVNIVAWEKKAELVSQHLHKGSLVGITGSLRIRSYEDDQGAKRKITEVLLDNLEFLESKKSGGDEYNSFQQPASSTDKVVKKAESNDDDFPFN